MQYFYICKIKHNTLTLIKSISGIRGTIGGVPEENLTPFDIVRFAAGFGAWIIENNQKKKVVIGSDARISGPMVKKIIVGTLQGMGIDVVDLGMATTPTVEMAVPIEKAGGGIIVTASHNPKQWNALKLLNNKGEFVSQKDGKDILRLSDSKDIHFAKVEKLGRHTQDDTYLKKHIDAILALPLVNIESIKNAGFKVVIDCVNSIGGIAVPELLKALGVNKVTKMYCEPNGIFPHNPEPLPENLSGIAHEVVFNKADLGIVVDPDVDRLAMVCEDGNMFGEEYTLVAVSDYVLSKTKGSSVSNLSSTRALRDVTHKHKCEYHAAAVGEVNVVNKMKSVDAVIGGEGNGGIIYPELHYGRDALVGIALFLSHLAKSGKRISVLRNTYPKYYMYKNKCELHPGLDVDDILKKIKNKYKKNPINTEDGVKIDFEDEWVHLRKSNTEPIVRIYTEGKTETTAVNIGNKIMGDIKELINENQLI